METVRFYERKGLIERPAKPAGGGFRDYTAETASQIRFIRQAQEIGFSLSEIRQLLTLRADPESDCAEVRTRAIEKRADVDRKIRQLERMRRALDTMISTCPGSGAVIACTIFDGIDGGVQDLPAERRTDHSNARNEDDQMKTTVIAIEGMHCDGCAQTIEVLLSRVSGVVKAEASYGDKRARVLHDQNSATEEDLIAAINKGGFKSSVEAA